MGILTGFRTLPRVLADRRPLPARFLILGSASPALLRQSTELLAGRIEIIEMGGLLLSEIGALHLAMIDAVAHDDTYFWATHQGAELDLLLFKGRRRLGVEVKRMDAPRLTPSMRIALEDLKLEQLVVLYPGPQE